MKTNLPGKLRHGKKHRDNLYRPRRLYVGPFQWGSDELAKLDGSLKPFVFNSIEGYDTSFGSGIVASEAYVRYNTVMNERYNKLVGICGEIKLK